MKLGTGNTPVGTKLDFNVMSNPFGIKKMTETEAIELIRSNGFRFKRLKSYGKTYCVKPIGCVDSIRDFMDSVVEDRFFTINGGIGIKLD